MSKQEIYAWTSLASSAALLGYSVLMVWGVPEGIGAYTEAIKGAFLQVIGIAVLVEVALDVSKRTAFGRVDKDERDLLIVVFVASITKSATQLFYYHTGI